MLKYLVRMLVKKYTTRVCYYLKMPKKIIYTGTRHEGVGLCFMSGSQLTFPRGFYSPYGARNVDWGNKSSDALQMSLMLLVEILGETSGVRALFAHRRFCDKIISKLPDSWEFTHEELEEKVIEILREV